MTQAWRTAAWFTISGWMFLVPYFVVKNEGRRGLGRLALFSMVYVAGWAVSIAVSIWMRVLVQP